MQEPIFDQTVQDTGINYQEIADRPKWTLEACKERAEAAMNEKKRQSQAGERSEARKTAATKTTTKTRKGTTTAK